MMFRSLRDFALWQKHLPISPGPASPKRGYGVAAGSEFADGSERRLRHLDVLLDFSPADSGDDDALGGLPDIPTVVDFVPAYEFSAT
jgi:hypothetical protein